MPIHGCCKGIISDLEIISELTYIWDASATSSMLKPDGSAVVNSGDAVRNWTSTGSLSKNLTKYSGSTSDATYGTFGVDLKPGVKSSSTNIITSDLYEADIWNHTMFIVADLSASTAGSIWGNFPNSGGKALQMYLQWVNGTYEFYFQLANGWGNILGPPNTRLFGVRCVLGIRFKWDSATGVTYIHVIHKDTSGAVYASINGLIASSASVLPFDTTIPYMFSGCSRFPSASGTDDVFHEIRIYNNANAMTDSNMINIYNALKTKWNAV